MATLRDIRQRIASVKNIAKITSAMKMVSASQMKRAQKAVESARPYFSKMEEMVSSLIAQAGDDYSHPLAIKRSDEVKNIAIIVIGSDRGLCGGFNTNLFKSLTIEIQDILTKEFPAANYQIIPVGKKPTGFYKRSNFTRLNEYPGIFASLDFKNAQDIVATVSEKFMVGEIDRVYVYYNKFVNIIRQIPTIHQLLPIEPVKADLEKATLVDYIYEPSQTAILDVLLPKLVDIILWRSLLESAAAEQASRMMAMDKATTNARDLIRSLDLQYNKARQSAITTEMLEIVSGAEALRSA